jgi:hypothetical protein
VTGEVVTGEAAARVAVRSAGYCAGCNRIVERLPTGECPNGHPAESVMGRIILGDDEPVPHLPRFNLAAFLIPPVWGPGNRQWAGAFFLPMWLFADSFATAAFARGGGALVMAVLLVAATLGMQLFYSIYANGLAWRIVSESLTVAEYLRRQRLWAIVSVPLALLIAGWGIGYHLFLR